MQPKKEGGSLLEAQVGQQKRHAGSSEPAGTYESLKLLPASHGKALPKDNTARAPPFCTWYSSECHTAISSNTKGAIQRDSGHTM